MVIENKHRKPQRLGRDYRVVSPLYDSVNTIALTTSQIAQTIGPTTLPDLTDYEQKLLEADPNI